MHGSMLDRLEYRGHHYIGPSGENKFMHIVFPTDIARISWKIFLNYVLYILAKKFRESPGISKVYVFISVDKAQAVRVQHVIG